MNITEKTLTDTLDFQVSACRRYLADKAPLSDEDRRGICNLYIERLWGIRMLLISHPKALTQVTSAVSELQMIRDQSAGVGRSPTQPAEAVE